MGYVYPMALFFINIYIPMYIHYIYILRFAALYTAAVVSSGEDTEIYPRIFTIAGFSYTHMSGNRGVGHYVVWCTVLVKCCPNWHRHFYECYAKTLTYRMCRNFNFVQFKYT